jgi:glucose-induced degradation protein 4
MVHWARFPAFRHVKNKLKAPHLTMDGYPGAVFMRWKERFLVPDHRVQDINGASFAGSSLLTLSRVYFLNPSQPGFYYVCVDFNPHPPSSTSPTRQSSTIREDPDSPPPPTPKAESLSNIRGSGFHEENSNPHHAPSLGTRSGPGVATMSGFYFHQNSEP